MRKDDEKIVSYESGYDLFYFPSGWFPLEVDPGEYSVLYIEPDPDYFEDISLKNESVRELLDSLKQEQIKFSSLGQVSINFIARNHINELLNDQLENSDVTLNMHLSVVGLLNQYLETWKTEKKSVIQSSLPHVTKMIKIRDEILHAPHIQKQRLKIISQRHGISMTELKKNFKLLCGTSPAAFIRMQALHKAHHLILHTKKTIDEISEEVGYGYRINFDRAFQKQFGYLASSLRRDKK
jgi:AraC-like DNA-binding protein